MCNILMSRNFLFNSQARVAALEDENVELKQQLELAASQTSDQIVPVPAPVQENLSQNNEEIELLKAQLSELQVIYFESFFICRTEI